MQLAVFNKAMKYSTCDLNGTVLLFNISESNFW